MLWSCSNNSTNLLKYPDSSELTAVVYDAGGSLPESWIFCLQARIDPGRPLNFLSKKRNDWDRELLRGAKAAGFPTDLWTCPRVAQLVQKQFRVHYHVDHIRTPAS